MNATLSSPVIFDRGKPFYPLIMNYVVFLIVIKELAVPGTALSNLMEPLELKSEFKNNYIRVEIDEIANEFINNAPYVMKSTMRSASSLLILAYEINKDKSWNDKGPLWEFLRHCRHAAAHNGLFTFNPKEPKRRAEWGHFRIERTLENTRLFKDEKGCGLLSPGDPIRLLWDIEQAYPNITV